MRLSVCNIISCLSVPEKPLLLYRIENFENLSPQGLMACAVDIAVTGPLGFFKGLVPAFVRLGPHTVLTFLFLEQLKSNFGYFPSEHDSHV